MLGPRALVKWTVIVIFCLNQNFTKGARIPNPDFETDWLMMQARNPALAKIEVDHGLGEVPILVDVQVKSLGEPNKDFMFPAVGCRPRDDDDAADFGGVIYVYNNESVMVSAPNQANGHSGAAIYTGEGTYYTGLNQQKSFSFRVRIRAWRAASLPLPDFHRTGLPLQAGSSDPNDVYIEESHGLGEYPILAKVRTRLTDGNLYGWYSDAVGSSMAVYPNYPRWTWSAFVIYGYSNETFRVWASSLDRGKLFDGTDGYDIDGVALTGEAELLAWKEETLSYTFKLTAQIGPGFINEKSEFTFGYNFSSDLFLVSTVHATGGPNLGFRFPGSGALVYTKTVTDSVCSYGGLVYAYTPTAIRFWRPEPVINGGMVCIGSVYGTGINAQSDPHGKAVTTLWASTFERVNPPTTTPKLRVFNWTPIVPRCVKKDL